MATPASRPTHSSAVGELAASNQYELPQEEEPPPMTANVPPPMRAFSVARSYFGGQKRPSDGTMPPTTLCDLNANSLNAMHLGCRVTWLHVLR